jgi:cyclohexanone monooxygenase
MPKPDHVFTAREKWLLGHVPGLLPALRQGIYGLTELVQLAERRPAAMRQLQRIALAHLARQVPDPTLRAQLTPRYTMGCKRILLSNDYYPALQAANAELVPHAVAEVTEDAVVGADGVRREVDTIIFGTGFRTTDAAAFGRVHGRGGRSLEETWGGSPEAYLGTTSHGFPNAFFLLGPNTGNGHGSAFVIIEAQARYIVDAIRTAGAETLEVRRAAQRRWNEEVQAALATSIWNAGGCASWYLDKNGRNSTIYPYTTIDLRRRLSAFDPAPFQLGGARKRPGPIVLAGAVVAITGGARGIGLATARRFADAGAVVCIGDLDEAEARLMAATLGPRAHGFALDVGRRASFAASSTRSSGASAPSTSSSTTQGSCPPAASSTRPMRSSGRPWRSTISARRWG